MILEKHKEKLDARKVRLVSFISFFMGFLQALFIYVMSTYFKEASGTENVGPFYLFSYAVVLMLLLNLHKLVRVFGKSFIFLLSLICKLASLALLLILPPSYLSIGALMLYIIAGSLEWVSLDIILESFSIDNMSGSIRGKHLTIINLGYLVGPFLSTQILSGFGYEGIFLVLLIANAFLLIIASLGLSRIKDSFSLDFGVRESLRKIWKRKNILRSYWASFVLDFFYSLVIIYTPIHLMNLGIPWEKIGIIFTLMLVPFVLVQYPLGIIADRKTGEKEWMFFSVLMMGASTAAMYFISSSEIWIWATVLFATRIGAAILEVMRDSYFYKRIDGGDVDVINFFRTSQSLAYIASSVMAFLIFTFYTGDPIRVIFLAVAAVIFSALLPIFNLKDNVCAKVVRKT